ncbi:hypothetical protein FWD20_02710 [Candidatus Saccharibacteria bacterium]|nr:hypothetical protein [Candidatus Saccharibacteria bacterium]
MSLNKGGTVLIGGGREASKRWGDQGDGSGIGRELSTIALGNQGQPPEAATDGADVERPEEEGDLAREEFVTSALDRHLSQNPSAYQINIADTILQAARDESADEFLKRVANTLLEKVIISASPDEATVEKYLESLRQLREKLKAARTRIERAYDAIAEMGLVN